MTVPLTSSRRAFLLLSYFTNKFLNEIVDKNTKKMSAKSKHDSKNAQADSVWSKALTAKTEWQDKEEFLDVIYWARQAIGIILGLCWGIVPLKGLIGLVLFVAVNAAIVYVYVSSFQQVDEEEYGGMWEITKEGFMTSFAGFLVTWIIVFTGLHGVL